MKAHDNPLVRLVRSEITVEQYVADLKRRVDEQLVERKPLSWETVRALEAAGSYETAAIARRLLRPRRRWYRLWRLPRPEAPPEPEATQVLPSSGPPKEEKP